MLVKATVILDVQNAKTYEEAYEVVFSFPGHCMSAWVKDKRNSVCFRKVLMVEGVHEHDPADQPIACLGCGASDLVRQLMIERSSSPPGNRGHTPACAPSAEGQLGLLNHERS